MKDYREEMPTSCHRCGSFNITGASDKYGYYLLCKECGHEEEIEFNERGELVNVNYNDLW